MDLTPLEKWLRDVGQHLHWIEAGCELIDRHLSQLEYRPHFETRCEEMMQETETRLERALHRVREARTLFAEKPLG